MKQDPVNSQYHFDNQNWILEVLIKLSSSSPHLSLLSHPSRTSQHLAAPPHTMFNLNIPSLIPILSCVVPSRTTPSRPIPLRTIPSRTALSRPVPLRTTPPSPVPLRTALPVSYLAVPPCPSRTSPYRPAPSRTSPYRLAPSRTFPYRPSRTVPLALTHGRQEARAGREAVVSQLLLQLPNPQPSHVQFTLHLRNAEDTGERM